MKVGVISIFPNLVDQIFQYGVVARARSKIDMIHIDLRDNGIGSHKRIDDAPYGGGAGMVLRYEPLATSIRALRKKLPSAPVLLSAASGIPLTQKKVKKLATYSELIVIAGRYEGVDERLIEAEIDEEFSIGDYVLSGGELAVMVLIDAMARLLPGVVGKPESVVEESFSKKLVEYPHYTRPQEIEGRRVPKVLTSGNHQEIKLWRNCQMEQRTRERRPNN